MEKTSFARGVRDGRQMAVRLLSDWGVRSTHAGRTACPSCWCACHMWPCVTRCMYSSLHSAPHASIAPIALSWQDGIAYSELLRAPRGAPSWPLLLPRSRIPTTVCPPTVAHKAWMDPRGRNGGVLMPDKSEQRICMLHRMPRAVQGVLSHHKTSSPLTYASRMALL